MCAVSLQNLQRDAPGLSCRNLAPRDYPVRADQSADDLAPDSPWAGIVQATVTELAKPRVPDSGRCDALLNGPSL